MLKEQEQDVQKAVESWKLGNDSHLFIQYPRFETCMRGSRSIMVFRPVSWVRKGTTMVIETLMCTCACDCSVSLTFRLGSWYIVKLHCA